MAKMKSEENKCKLCGEVHKLGKSHIIPEAFFTKYRTPNAAAMMLTNTAGYFPKKSWNGIYDPSILCQDCERKFQDFDNYGVKVLLRDMQNYFTRNNHHDGNYFLHSNNIDQQFLLKFLISVLWRASVSSNKFYNKVNLGPFEPLAANVILNPHGDVPNCFAGLLSYWINDKGADGDMLMDPFREKWGDVNAYRVYLGFFVAYVKVDQRQWVAPFSRLALGIRDELHVTSRNLEGSNDSFALSRTATEAILHAQRKGSA